MKDLLLCWWLKLDRFLKISVLTSVLFTPLFSLTIILISPETRGEIFQREFTIYMGWLMFFIRASGVLLIFLLVIDCIAGDSLIQIIRFKKTFFFLPPSTRDGLAALQSYVDNILKGLAENLEVDYQIEEGLLSDLKRPETSSPYNVLNFEKQLRETKELIKEKKKKFYSSRNLLDNVGFKTNESYKKYLKEQEAQ